MPLHDPRQTSAALLLQFPDAVTASEPAGEYPVVRCKREAIGAVLEHLKRVCGFDLLADLTVVDWPEKSERFDLIYNLYSLAANDRLLVEVGLSDAVGELPSAVPLWASANWFEREAWDMFGIRFTGHPNLKRILMYDGFDGHPLRKDYDVRRRQPIVPEHEPPDLPDTERDWVGLPPPPGPAART